MNLYVFSYTKGGSIISTKLYEFFSNEEDVKFYAYANGKYCNNDSLKPIESLNDNFFKSIFGKGNIIIFIGAIGIAVRKIAPYIKNKLVDPAVIVIDEQGKYVIPILSGHVGRANEFSRKIGKVLNSEVVITTATDLQGKFSVDTWATNNNYEIINSKEIKYISSAILDNIPVGIVSDFKMDKLPKGITEVSGASHGIYVSPFFCDYPFKHTLHITPKCIVVGMGCRKGVKFENVEKIFLDKLNELKISIHAVRALATINLKKEEASFIELCKKYNLDFITYSPSELSKVKGDFTKSPFVEGVTGVDNVCERASTLASKNGILICKKISTSGVTMAISKDECVLRW